MVQKKRVKAFHSAKVQAHGPWTPSECACSVLTQDSERSFRFSKNDTSFGWENKSFDQNFMITVFMTLGPNYKCNLCIGNPLEISIKFDTCAFSILS